MGKLFFKKKEKKEPRQFSEPAPKKPKLTVLTKK
jgi:hypothetical protein